MATLRELAVLAKPTRVERDAAIMEGLEAEGALVMADVGRLPRHLATLEAWLRAMTARMPASR